MTDKIYVRLFDFRIYNEDLSEDSSDEEEKNSFGDKKETVIQMYGMNDIGKTFAINVMNFEPFFYVKVPQFWDARKLKDFKEKVKNEIGPYYSSSVNNFKYINKKKLYGFDNNKTYNFIKITFNNTSSYNKVKNLWYTKDEDFRKRQLIKNGFLRTELYEAKLPPLLRFFHIKDISPSGWVSFKERDIDSESSETCCDYEYWIDYDNITSEKKKEDAIPLKICSFDIEASSSHGDFPLAKKTYLKLCRQIVNYWTTNKKTIKNMEIEEKTKIFADIIYTAFEYGIVDGIDKIYLKDNEKKPKKSVLEYLISNMLKNSLWYYLKKLKEDGEETVEETQKREEEIMEDEDIFTKKKKKRIYFKNKEFYKNDILYLLNSKEDPTLIADMLELIFKKEHFPKVEGDTVTFIGSTFMKLGEKDQYLNHMVVLNSCSSCPEVPNCEIETYDSERNLLLAWTKMIQREDPDIVIGYNIFGFDYKFMIERAEELKCKREFLKLGRLIGEQSRVIESSIKIASGTHDLKYIKMEGRIQIDLYNHFRREINLPSYKLDNVASHFIGDIITDIDSVDEKTIIQSKNLMGLKDGHYICFEILGHSTDKYKQGKKFIVEQLNNDSFIVNCQEVGRDLKGKKCRWCLAKDDVTPQDIFRLTNEGPDERAIIAKYCFQDCNLVHNLLMKNDIFTGMSEIANICYVPVEFIVMRGQGIKLLSFIAKKCSYKNTLMPVLDVEKGDSSYEGAICLKPYCGLYIDNPVAVVDYASLYPSSMISENISHDSKVWTKEYDLNGNIEINNMGNEMIWGERDKEGNFKYDNLPEYEYVDITYDRYIWRRKGTGKAQEKIKVGTKTCRFAQFPDGKKAIMPAVLHELLAGRKATRKFIKYKTVKLSNGEEISGLYTIKDKKCKIVSEKEVFEFNEEDVVSVKDTYDDFMKNVFDKRQQGLKVTANSLYGQTGARTSSFYEMDIAASTTATGRKLLIYGKKIIEGIYGDKICDTTHGKIRCKSKVVYGDSVVGNEPLILQDENEKVVIKTIESLSNEWVEYDNFKPFDTIESNRREKQKAFVKYKVWANGKWNPIKKVIRHKTNKNIYRVNTHIGVVDVTGDHSLVNDKLEKIKPTDCMIGKTKLSHTFPDTFSSSLNEDWDTFYDKNKDVLKRDDKMVPDIILNASFAVRKAFWTRFCDEGKSIKISIENKLNAQCLYYLATSIGYNNLSINYKTKNDNDYYTISSCKKWGKEPTILKKMEIIRNSGEEYVYDLETEDGIFACGVGKLQLFNTDSCFMTFNAEELDGTKIIGKKALDITIQLAIECGELASKFLKPPHDLEYEKTFDPFLLLSKKRYVGMLYEHDRNKCKRKSMGIVLKRRDNAPVVKDVYGGIIDIIMKEQNIEKAVLFLKTFLKEIIDEKIPLDKLIITKSLREFYKCPESIAHKVLADRMGKRDPGNKPSTGSRIPFVFIKTKKNVKLQGEKIEHPDYIKEHGLKPDYKIYITNQIMKPVMQIFALVLENLKVFKTRKRGFERKIRSLERKWKDDDKKCVEDIMKVRNKHVKELLFDDILRVYTNKQNGQQTITGLFGI